MRDALKLALAGLVVALATDSRSGVTFTMAAAGDCTSVCYVDAISGDDVTKHGTSAADAFKTLSRVISTVQAGGTVHVAPGLYNPNFTDVPASVILLGAKAGVDPLIRDPNDAATESIIQSNTGLGIKGAGSLVSVDGFTFKEKTVNSSVAIATGSGASDVGATVTVVNNIFYRMNIALSSGLATNASSLAISNNLFMGTALAGRTGIQVNGGGTAATLSITLNRFEGLSRGGISALRFNGANVSNNSFVSTGSGNGSDPIQVGGCTSCVVSGNTITSTAGFDAISVIGSSGPSVNTTVSNNTITGPTRVSNWAIFLGQATGTTITGNTITGAREAGITFGSTAPSGSVTDTTISGNTIGGAGAIAINIKNGASGVTITNNTISGVGKGIRLEDHATATGNTISGATLAGVEVLATAEVPDTHINRNSIAGNTAGLTSATATAIDATCNWWGNASGPAGLGPGTGDSVSANATFISWLTTSVLATGPCDGTPGAGECPGLPNIPVAQGATGEVFCGPDSTISTARAIGPGPLPDVVSAVFEWSNNAQAFRFWFRGFPDSFQTLKALLGGHYYFFQATSAGQIANSGTIFALPAAGTEQIGATAIAGANGAIWAGNGHALATFDSYPSIAQVTAIFGWNNAQQKFDFWFRGFPLPFQTLIGGIVRGKYYFFQAPAGSTIPMN